VKARLLPLVLTLAGCSSLLGLDEFEDAPAGSSGGQAGSGGAAGAAGAGGSSDGGPDAAVPFVCTELLDKDMISEGDLLGKKLELKSARVIRSRHDPSMVFAVATYIAGGGNFGVVVRTHRDSEGSPGSMQTVVSSGHFIIADGYADQSFLYLWGFREGDIVKLRFDLTPTGVNPNVPPMDFATSTPTECHGPVGYPRQLAFDEGWTTDDYVLTCQNNAGTNRYVYLGGNGSFDPVTSGPIQGTDSPAYRVRGVRHDGEFLIALDDGLFAHGSPGSWKLKKLDLAGSGEMASMLGIFPHPKGGTLIMPARVDLKSFVGAVYAGTFKASDYGKLDDKTRYAQVLEISGYENFPRLEHMAAGPVSLVSAGVTVDDQHVRFLKLDRSGNPIVFQQLTKPKNLSDTSVADAVPFGLSGAFDTVVWSQSNPPLIRLAKLVCQPKK